MLARLARMTFPELAHRGAAAGRIAADRLRTRVSGSWWDRRLLLPALASDGGDLDEARKALAAERWDDAHRAVSAHLSNQPARFTISIRAAATTRSSGS